MVRKKFKVMIGFLTHKHAYTIGTQAIFLNGVAVRIPKGGTRLFFVNFTTIIKKVKEKEEEEASNGYSL